MGISRAEVCHPEGSVLPVGGIGGTGIELQAVLLPLGDVGGGTGHGRPGQFCGAVVDIDIRQAGLLTSASRGCHEDIRSQPAGGEHGRGTLRYAAGGGQIHHLLSVAVESALTIRLLGQEDGLLQIRGDLQLPDAVGGQQVGQQPRQLAALQPRQSVPALIQLLRVTQAAQGGVHGAGDGLGRPVLLLVLEEDLPIILAPEEGELSLRQGTGEGLGGQGLTVCVKYAVGAGGRCRDHGGIEGGLAGPIGDLIAGVHG